MSKKPLVLDTYDGLIARDGKAEKSAAVPTRPESTPETPKPAFEHLNFRTEPDFAWRFREYAVRHRMSQLEVLYKAFETLERQGGR